MRQHIQRWLRKPWVVAALIAYLVFVVWVYSLIFEQIKHSDDPLPSLTYEEQKERAFKALPSPCSDCDYRLVHVEPPPTHEESRRVFIFVSPEFGRRTICVFNDNVEDWGIRSTIPRYDLNYDATGTGKFRFGGWTKNHYDPLNSTQTGGPTK